MKNRESSTKFFVKSYIFINRTTSKSTHKTNGRSYSICLLESYDCCQGLSPERFRALLLMEETLPFEEPLEEYHIIAKLAKIKIAVKKRKQPIYSTIVAILIVGNGIVMAVVIPIAIWPGKIMGIWENVLVLS